MKFLKKSNTESEVPTAALPDIIFMLLFFFMVSTVMRETEVRVKQDLPRAEQLVKLQRKDLVAHIYVGKPKSEELGTQPLIQADGSYIKLENLGSWVKEVREGLAEPEKKQLTISLKIDEDVRMGLIVDIQKELRKVDARKIIYQSPKKDDQ